jgi:hypothetical protein
MTRASVAGIVAVSAVQQVVAVVPIDHVPVLVPRDVVQIAAVWVIACAGVS